MVQFALAMKFVVHHGSSLPQKELERRWNSVHQ